MVVSVSSIASEAKRIHSFISLNLRDRASRFQQVANLPVQWDFTAQVNQLNQMIISYLQSDSPPAITAKFSHLRARIAQMPLESSLEAFAPLIRSVQETAERYIPQNPVPVDLDPYSSEEDESKSAESSSGSSASSEPEAEQESLASEEDGLEENASFLADEEAALEMPIDDDVLSEHRRIIEVYSKNLQFIDYLIDELYQLPEPNPWKQAIDEANPALFSIFPGLIGALQVQRSGPNDSCEELNAEERQRIQEKLTFETIRDYLGRELSDGPIPDDIAPLLQKLKLIGIQNRQQSDLLLSQGLMRQELIAHQKQTENQIPDLSVEDVKQKLKEGMKAESMIYIRPILQNRLNDLSDAAIVELTHWLVRRGYSDELPPLLERIPSLDACITILKNTRPEFPEIRELLGVHIEESLSALGDLEIQQLFENALEEKHERILPLFLSPAISPKISDELLRLAFQELVQQFKISQFILFAREDLCQRLDANAAFQLAATIINSKLDWDKMGEYLDQFVESPLFARLQQTQYVKLCNRAIEIGSDACFKYLLDLPNILNIHLSKLNQEEYNFNLMLAALKHEWVLVNILLENREYRAFSGAVLGTLLSKISEQMESGEEKQALIDQITGLENPEDPITHEVYSACYFRCLKKYETESVIQLLNKFPITLPKIEQSLEFAFQKGYFSVILPILRQPEAIRIKEELIRRAYSHAIMTNEEEIFQIDFENPLSRVYYQLLISRILEGGNTHLLERIWEKFSKDELDLSVLASWAKEKVRKNDQSAIKRLFTFLEDEAREIAFSLDQEARTSGHADLSAWIWNWMWRASAGPLHEPPPADEPPPAAKRRKR